MKSKAELMKEFFDPPPKALPRAERSPRSLREEKQDAVFTEVLIDIRDQLVRIASTYPTMPKKDVNFP